VTGGHQAAQPCGFTLRIVLAGNFASFSAGRIGRRSNSPPQFGPAARKRAGGAIGAEGAFEGADEGAALVGGQVGATAFAIRAQFKHGILPL